MIQLIRTYTQAVAVEFIPDRFVNALLTELLSLEVVITQISSGGEDKGCATGLCCGFKSS